MGIPGYFSDQGIGVLDMSLSVLILTLNEETTLPACLNALQWCDDIVVLDSYSSDRTVEIARKFGARIYQRGFDSFAAQRNWGLSSISFKHEWVFHLDADEVFTDALLNEIRQTTPGTSYDAFHVPSKMMFLGKWLRFSGMYPTYQVRLTRRERFTFRQVGHGQKEDIDQLRIGTLREPYLHYSFSKGITDWFNRHNRYSSLEAEATLRNRKANIQDWKGLISANRPRRRRALKTLSLRLPFRPLIRFVYMYFLRLGFLDGSPGFVYSILLSFYEYMIVLKTHELEKAEESHHRNTLFEKGSK